MQHILSIDALAPHNIHHARHTIIIIRRVFILFGTAPGSQSRASNRRGAQGGAPAQCPPHLPRKAQTASSRRAPGASIACSTAMGKLDRLLSLKPACKYDHFLNLKSWLPQKPSASMRNMISEGRPARYRAPNQRATIKRSKSEVPGCLTQAFSGCANMIKV
jgi:hypothetical protein